MLKASKILMGGGALLVALSAATMGASTLSDADGYQTWGFALGLAGSALFMVGVAIALRWQSREISKSESKDAARPRVFSRHPETLPISTRPGPSSNDWPSEWVTKDFEPRLRASIVVPAYNNQPQLDAVLAGLELQDYPLSLFEVIVADDGTNPPLTVAGSRIRVTAVHRLDEGYRLAAGRNLGAAAATGDVVVFLDSDMIPEPQWLTGHMRVHHHCDWALVCGFRRHVGVESVEPSEVLEAGGPEALFVDEESRTVGWIENYWNDHDDGRIDSDSIWRVTSGGNLSIPKEAFDLVGGFDAEFFKEWGGEDNDFGFRAYQTGVMVVPAREALAWHLGWGTSPTDRNAETKMRMERVLASRIPDPGLPSMGAVQPHFPWLWLQIDASDFNMEQVCRQVAQALAAPISCVVSVQAPPGATLPNGLSAILEHDARVQVGRHNDAPPSWFFAPTRMRTTSVSLTTADIHRLAVSANSGLDYNNPVAHSIGAEAWLTRTHAMADRGLIRPTAAFLAKGEVVL